MPRNDYGRFSLHEFTSSLNVDDVIKALRTQFEQSLETNPVNIGDIQVTLSKSITGFGGHRYWFVCPSCSSRVARLYIEAPVVACRHCLQVKYRSSRYKGMLEDEIGRIDLNKK
jgi:hypothetical protein